MDLEEKKKKKKKKNVSPLWFIIPLSILALGFLCYVPFWINSAYLKGGDYQTVWNGSEFLAFYGALLSALGTLFLGGLSIWQNHVLKDENDKSQKRLESIIIRSNEINSVNRIVESETNRIEKMIVASDLFTELCIVNIAKESKENSETIERYVNRLKEKLLNAKSCFFRLLAGEIYHFNESIELRNKADKLYKKTIEFYDRVCKDPQSLGKRDFDAMSDVYSDFVKSKDLYLINIQFTVTELLMGKTTIDDIKQYYKEPWEAENGQDEDAE